MHEMGHAIKGLLNFPQWSQVSKPDEVQALQRGYNEALSEGWQGSIDDFLNYQQELYKTAEEGDPRLKTYFYKVY